MGWKHFPVLALALGAFVVALPAGAAPHPRVIGGTSADRAALAGVLVRLQSSGTRAELAPGPRAGYRGHRKTLTFLGASDPESQWKDLVAAGVFLALGRPVAWVAIPGLGAGRFSYRGMDAIGRAGFMRALRRAAKRSQVTVDRVVLLKPRALAPVVTVTARHPVSFERKGFELAVLDSSPPRLEGMFLIVRGPRGHVMTRGGIAVRAGTGAGRWPGSVHGGGGVPEP
jgi:hypothetical protein